MSTCYYREGLIKFQISNGLTLAWCCQHGADIDCD
jgi:hypothetical protein